MGKREKAVKVGFAAFFFVSKLIMIQNKENRKMC